MVLAVLLLIPFVPGVFMDEGVVKDLDYKGGDEGILVHTWYQQDVSSPNDLYKLECFLTKDLNKYQFIAKLYFQEDLLHTLLVSRFDEDLLESVKVFRRSNDGNHLVRYELTDENEVLCQVYMYQKNDAGTYSSTSRECRNRMFAKIWSNRGKGWKWDVDTIKGKEPKGAVEKIDLKDKELSEEPLHTWSNRHFGFRYTMSVTKVKEGNYYATLNYLKEVVDKFEVISLGDKLLNSVTVLGRDSDHKNHVVQYKMTSNRCVKVEYPITTTGGTTANKKSTRKTSRCLPLIFRRLSIILDSLFASHRPDNGWNW